MFLIGLIILIAFPNQLEGGKPPCDLNANEFLDEVMQSSIGNMPSKLKVAPVSRGAVKLWDGVVTGFKNIRRCGDSCFHFASDDEVVARTVFSLTDLLFRSQTSFKRPGGLGHVWRGDLALKIDYVRFHVGVTSNFVDERMDLSEYSVESMKGFRVHIGLHGFWRLFERMLNSRLPQEQMAGESKLLLQQGIQKSLKSFTSFDKLPVKRLRAARSRRKNRMNLKNTVVPDGPIYSDGKAVKLPEINATDTVLKLGETIMDVIEQLNLESDRAHVRSKSVKARIIEHNARNGTMKISVNGTDISPMVISIQGKGGPAVNLFDGEPVDGALLPINELFYKKLANNQQRIDSIITLIDDNEKIMMYDDGEGNKRGNNYEENTFAQY